MIKIISNTKNKVNLASIQNSTAKYLYNNLGGGYSYIKHSTGAEVKSIILYQVPLDIRKQYRLTEEQSDVYEMDITINLTTYSNKLRVEIIEISPNEKTLAFKTFKDTTFVNVQQGIKNVYDYVCKVIRKEFQNYDVLF